MDDSEARAFAMRVLEHPGGPYSRTPEGGRAPRAAKALLYLSSNTFETFEGEGARTIRRIETRNKARDMARQANAKAERASRKISENEHTAGRRALEPIDNDNFERISIASRLETQAGRSPELGVSSALNSVTPCAHMSGHSTISLRLCLASAWPPMSPQRTVGTSMLTFTA